MMFQKNWPSQRHNYSTIYKKWIEIHSAELYSTVQRILFKTRVTFYLRQAEVSHLNLSLEASTPSIYTLMVFPPLRALWVLCVTQRWYHRFVCNWTFSEADWRLVLILCSRHSILYLVNELHLLPRFDSNCRFATDKLTWKLKWNWQIQPRTWTWAALKTKNN